MPFSTSIANRLTSNDEVIYPDILQHTVENETFDKLGIPKKVELQDLEQQDQIALLDQRIHDEEDPLPLDERLILTGRELHKNQPELYDKTFAFLSFEIDVENSTEAFIQLGESFADYFNEVPNNPVISRINERYSKLEAYILNNTRIEATADVTRALEVIREQALVTWIGASELQREHEEEFELALLNVGASLSAENITQGQLDHAYEYICKLLSRVSAEDFNSEGYRLMRANSIRADHVTQEGRLRLQDTENIINRVETAKTTREGLLPEGFTNEDYARDVYRLVAHHYKGTNFRYFEGQDPRSQEVKDAIYRMCGLLLDTESEHAFDQNDFVEGIAYLNSILSNHDPKELYSIGALLGASRIAHMIDQTPEFADKKGTGFYHYGTSKKPITNPKAKNAEVFVANRALETLEQQLRHIGKDVSGYGGIFTLYGKVIPRIRYIYPKLTESISGISQNKVTGITKYERPPETYMPIDMIPGNKGIAPEIKPSEW